MKFLMIFIFLFSERAEDLKQLLSRGSIEPESKTLSSLENGALGLQDLGEVSNVITNWGVLTTSPMFITPSLHWPKSAPFQHQYSYGTHLFVARKDNVITIHNRNDETSSDWTPLRTHSGAVELAGGWPMMATSDDPRTWPDGIWPGPYRIDPNTGLEVEGEFVSDRDHYGEYDDSGNLQGSLGIKISQVSYCYGRYYAEDILVFRVFIENTSDSVIHNLYTGFWTAIWVDFDEADLLDFVHLYDTTGQKNFVYYWDADGIPDDPWVSVGYMGFGVLTTPYNMGITDFHYWEKTFEPYTDEVLWPIISSDTSDPDIIPSRYFHSDTNIHIDDTPPEEGAGIYRVLLSTGPFDLNPGDTVELAIFSCAGNDTSDLFTNARTVFKMKENYYQGPSAPPPPVVRLVPDDRKVLLYWDPFPSETTPDPFTGEYDFEGYKIYRSDDGGVTWGDPITNEKGEVVGYVPVAIFDLIDGIKGTDPANPYQSLGEDSGLKYEFQDTGLINGRLYVYAVTAYDRGNQNPDSLAPSLESYKKIDSVMPSPRPSDLLPGDISDTLLSPLNGLCDAETRIIPLDLYSLKDNNYRVVVKVDTQKYITLLNLTSGDTLLKNYSVPDTLTPFAFPETEGFRLYVKDKEPPGFKESVWHEVKNDTTDFEWFTESRSTHGEAKHEGLDVFYIEIDTTVQSFAQVLRPLSLNQYNTYVPVDTPPYPLPLKAYVHPHIYRDTLIPVDKYFLLEPRFVHPNPPPGYFSEFGWDIIPGGKAWVELEANRYLYPDELGFLYYYRDSTGAIYDSSLVYVRTLNGPDSVSAPSQGDVFKIELKKPLWDGLIYEFNTSSPGKTPSYFNPLSKVKVVPNPYIKGRTNLGEEKLMFLNVPQNAKIKIFTLYGEPVITLRSQGTGSIYWNLRNRHGIEISYGLYLYVVESEGRKKIGKFAIIK